MCSRSSSPNLTDLWPDTLAVNVWEHLLPMPAHVQNFENFAHLMEKVSHCYVFLLSWVRLVSFHKFKSHLNSLFSGQPISFLHISIELLVFFWFGSALYILQRPVLHGMSCKYTFLFAILFCLRGWIYSPFISRFLGFGFLTLLRWVFLTLRLFFKNPVVSSGTYRNDR